VTARQTYITLGNLLNIAVHLKIDSTPIEGFEPAQYDKIPGLKAQGYTATVVSALCYRSAEDDTAKAPKARQPQLQLFEVI
jgi:nitroreductase